MAPSVRSPNPDSASASPTQHADSAQTPTAYADTNQSSPTSCQTEPSPPQQYETDRKLSAEYADGSSVSPTRYADTDSAKDSLNSLLERESRQEGTDCVEEALECASLAGPACARGCAEQRQKRRNFYLCGTHGKALGGAFVVLMSLVSFVFTPLDLMLWEKMNMRPGLPPFDWWADPPDEVKLRVYVFNVTNHERFLQGLDDRIHLEEIGPIVYLEKLLHYNVVFNENSTMTYTAQRIPIYLPHENTVDLSQTIVVPNLAVLGLASYLCNANYLIRAAFRLMVQSHKSTFFVERTIQDYLWDFRDPVLATSKTLAPGLVPVDNMGILARMYADFTDEMTVHIGSGWGHKRFFQLDRFRGETQLPGYDPDKCPDRVFGSTEGVMYAQRLTKQDRLLYWRKSVCKLMPLYFDDEMTIDDIPVYRFNLSEQVFDRVTNGTDCYDSIPHLVNGLSDASRCYFDFPMVISYPHFYTGSPPKDKYVTGLKPDRNKHNSYAVVEPLTGTPMHSVARMQSNLRTTDLSGFGAQYHRFSDLVVPMFWAEYNQEGLPDYIRKTVYFAVVVLPPLQAACSALCLLAGCCVLARVLTRASTRGAGGARSPSAAALLLRLGERNKMLSFNNDSILNKIS